MKTCSAALLASLLAAALPAPAQVNPFARYFTITDLNGRWNGVNLELRSNCSSAQNNGNRGTYAQFDLSFGSSGEFVIAQSGITGLNCEYRGRYDAPYGTQLEGTYSCTDGKQGAFTARAGPVGASLLHVELATQLTGSESCSIKGVLSMARLLS